EEFVTCSRYGELEDMKAMMDNYLESHPEASKCALASKQNAYGSTALHMAAANGHIDIIKYLIDDCNLSKKELEIKNDEGNTPLHWAALNGYLEAVKLLMTSGASGNIKNNADKEPGYYAELKGHQDIVNYILRAI
ncbi:ankyrin, partial [Anaeromyces robustus]